MSDTQKGKRLKLSPTRRLAIDMLHHARQVPSVPVARALNVAAVAAAPAQAVPSPSWTAIFLRAYGLVAAQVPELRRALIPWPRPHLYEHPHSIAALVVERELEGEPVLLAAKVRSPESSSLSDIQNHLHRFKEAPLREISCFRQLLRLARAPGLFRRFIFWQSLYWSGAKRAKRFGTFMVSSYGSLGAEQLHPLSPLTTLLTFGPINPAGDVIVKVIYDHRVMDGRRVAQALQELDRTLQTTILQELRGLHHAAA
jgi:hypothetical protein